MNVITDSPTYVETEAVEIVETNTRLSLTLSNEPVEAGLSRRHKRHTHRARDREFTTFTAGELTTQGINPSLVDCPKVIDLFAGVGGLSLGAARAGFHVELAVEHDANAYDAHRRNFPNSRHRPWNISHITGLDLLQEVGLIQGELDGLIGGPPCQGFSIIGQRKVIDPRNELFVKFYELVAQCQPRFFIAENVPHILAEQYKDILNAANKFVEGEYTLLEPMLIKASEYGCPTVRERAFFIGYRNNTIENLTQDDFNPPSDTVRVVVQEALRGLPKRIRRTWLTEEQSWRQVETLDVNMVNSQAFWDRVSGVIPPGVGDPDTVHRYQTSRLTSGCFGTRHSPEVEARYRRLEPGQKDEVSRSVRLRSDGFCPTLRAGTASDHGRFQAVRPIHPTLARVITPREAARLQGFPDWFRFAPSKWQSFRQIGNSVSPIVAEAVLRVIREKL